MVIYIFGDLIPRQRCNWRILQPQSIPLSFWDMPIVVFVIYWPSTKPSIKRCTYVNKRKNSRSRWTLENNIAWCPDTLRQLKTRCQSEIQLADWGLCALRDPRLSNASQDEEDVLLWERKNLGQYSSPFLSPLISHTQQTSTLSKIKCERFIFI